MTRKKLARSPMEHRDKPKLIELPTCWSPAQATAVFEFLDELRNRVLDHYVVEIREFLQEDRVTTTRLKHADTKDGDAPF
jgi:hypothetical protein